MSQIILIIPFGSMKDEHRDYSKVERKLEKRFFQEHKNYLDEGQKVFEAYGGTRKDFLNKFQETFPKVPVPRPAKRKMKLFISWVGYLTKSMDITPIIQTNTMVGKWIEQFSEDNRSLKQDFNSFFFSIGGEDIDMLIKQF